MTEKKKKNDQASDNTEFSFDFGQIGERIKEFVGSLAGDEELQESNFGYEKGNAKEAAIKIDFSVGRATFRALPEGDENIMTADLKHVGEVDFTVANETSDMPRLRLRQNNKISGVQLPIRQGFSAIANNEQLQWDIHVTPDLPLEINVDGGVGPVEMDLSGLQVTDLDVETGVGTLNLTLPAHSGLHADVDGGVGQTTINIPAGYSGELSVEGGVGEIRINAPVGVAIQLRGDVGIGSINLPAEFIRTKGKREFLDNSGVWETEGFDLAEEKIIIKYEGGIGALNLRYTETV